jgi:hypothetical protein
MKKQGQFKELPVVLPFYYNPFNHLTLLATHFCVTEPSSNVFPSTSVRMISQI